MYISGGNVKGIRKEFVGLPRFFYVIIFWRIFQGSPLFADHSGLIFFSSFFRQLHPDGTAKAFK